MVELKYTVTHSSAVPPSYGSDGAGAFDFSTLEDTTLQPGETKLLRTGLSFEVPRGYFLAVVPRSSTGLRTPLRQSNSFGVVDSDYRGEVQLLFTNTSSEPYFVKSGSRLCQGFLVPVVPVSFEKVLLLSPTERGGNGFGSTGA